MNFNSTATTNKILIIMVLPVIFYVLHLLAFIFIPLFFAIFLALLFMPMMRWLKSKKVPRIISVSLAVIILLGSIYAMVTLVSLSGNELKRDRDELYQKLNKKAGPYLAKVADYLEIEREPGQTALKSILTSEKVGKALFANVSSSIVMVQKAVNITFVTLFFLILLLSDSLNFKEVLQLIFFKKSYPSTRTFLVIEKSIVKFIRVKTIVSLCTGICIGLTCYFFGLSFPFFWGLFGFAINYLQFVGSVMVTILVAVQAFIEINFPGTYIAVVAILIGIQLIFGSILEPILLGRSFSINVLAVIIMLMFWGFLWGIPGLVLSIPLTVLIKTILEQFPNTKRYAILLS